MLYTVNLKPAYFLLIGMHQIDTIWSHNLNENEAPDI